MDILHHGAVDGVTGSCHELRLNETFGVLIDCGLFQGDERSGEAGADSLEIDFPIVHIKALIVTHVHIDHVGRIPYLLAAGFTGPIICSEPSSKLLPLVLEDAVKIGFTRNKALVDRFLKVIEKQILSLPYGERFVLKDELAEKSKDGLANELEIKLKPAGHILGSAYVECRSSADQKKVIFSGDLGAPYSPILSSPRSPYGCDVLVIESTYGDKQHSGRRKRKDRLKSIIERSVQDRGVVLIPAFSIGRTQELLYELESIIHRHQNSSLWKEIEVLIDSPLAAKFTDVYRELKPYWDKEAQRRLLSGRHPLSFDQLTTIDSHQDHVNAVSYLQRTARPTIVIAASGMCAGGRIVNYLKALIEDKRTDILFVGYQARGTAGRDILRYADKKDGYVVLDGERKWIKAKVHSISGYSAHADQSNLVNFVKRMRKKPEEIRIVHGDDNAKATLKGLYETLLEGRGEVIIASVAE